MFPVVSHQLACSLTVSTCAFMPCALFLVSDPHYKYVIKVVLKFAQPHR